MKKLFQTLIAFSMIVAGDALALPFQADPQSFTSYLNQLKWNDGKRRVFANLSSCEETSPKSQRKGYFCEFGYVTISDPVRGRIFCELQKKDWFGVVSHLSRHDGTNTTIEHGNAYPCRKA